MYERWGLVGACWATGMTMAITTLFIGWVLLRELQWPLGQCWQDLSPLWRPITGGLLAMALMTAAMLAAGLNWSSGWPVRIAVTLFGTAVYAICCFRYYYMPLRKAHRLALS
jgi:Na+-driven multidrug efflux pump